MTKTAIDQDDFEFDPEEFARVIREVGVEVTKFQEHVMNAYMQFGNAWNKIITPEFREMVERAVEKKNQMKGADPKYSIMDEVPLFEMEENNGKS